MKRLLLILFAIFLIASPVQGEFFKDIIITSPTGIWTDSRAYTTLSDAITTIGASEQDLYIAREETVTTLVIPSNIRLHFVKDGSISNSNTLTINTKNIHSDHQIFTGAGAVNFASGTEVRTRWFEDFETAITQTANDTVTLLVDTTDTLANSAAVGNNVTLKWNFYNLITIANGQTLSNIGDINAPGIRLFIVSGTISFRASSPLKEVRADWFGNSLATLDIIDNAVAAAGKILLITPGAWVIDTNITLDSHTRIFSDTDLQIDTNITLTINGSLDAGLYPIFSCTGTGKVVFGSQKAVYPEWWGAVINAPATDCGLALNRAIASLTYGAVPITGLKGGVVELQVGTYYVGTQINLASDVTFRGYGGMSGSGTVLQRSANITMFSGVGVSILDPAYAHNQILRVKFEGLTFQGETWGSTTYTADLIDLKACKNFKWSDCGFENVFGRVLDTWELFDSRFYDCYFNHCGNGASALPVMEFKSASATYERTNNLYFIGCVWESSRYSHIKTTGTEATHPTSELFFSNCKFENNDNLATACAALDFLNCQKVEFSNVIVWTQLAAAMTEIIKFDRCNHIKGNMDIGITNAGAGSLARIMTIATAAGVWDCHANLFLSGTSWDLITEAAGVNIDSVLQAANINIRSYGGTIGYACSTKALTNYPRQSESLYGSAITTNALAGTAGDWMAVYNHGKTAGGVDTWVNRVFDNNTSTWMDWMRNTASLYRLLFDGDVQVLAGDLQILPPGHGIILTNRAGTVTKRVRLDDAGTGLLYEALTQLHLHTIAITVVNPAVAQTDTITIRGIICSFTSDATPTTAEISAGLQAAIAAETEVAGDFTVSGVTSVILTPITTDPAVVCSANLVDTITNHP